MVTGVTLSFGIFGITTLGSPVKPGDLLQLHPSVIFTYTYDSNGSTGEKFLNNTPGLTMVLLGFVDFFTMKRCKVLLPGGRITHISDVHLEVVK